MLVPETIAMDSNKPLLSKCNSDAICKSTRISTVKFMSDKSEYTGYKISGTTSGGADSEQIGFVYTNNMLLGYIHFHRNTRCSPLQSMQ